MALVARGTVIGRDAEDVWVDDDGRVAAGPIDDADTVPGRFIIAGLVDAHAHPAIAKDAGRREPRDLPQAEEELRAWARVGVTHIRDTGSPGGVMLGVPPAPGLPAIDAVGRFFSPPGRYFPGLYTGVPQERLLDEVIAEIDRGARWIKLIGDFPERLEPPFRIERTYDEASIAAVCAAAHARGARVAVHSTIDNVREIVEAGVDSIEHGRWIDETTLEIMRERGTVWVPTLCGLIDALGTDLSAEAQARVLAERERIGAMLQAARRLGVPVLTGSDIVGTVPREVALLASVGLDPAEAIAAATTAGYALLRADPWATGAPANVVTYDADPREDVAVLERPTAVIVAGARLS